MQPEELSGSVYVGDVLLFKCMLNVTQCDITKEPISIWQAYIHMKDDLEICGC